MNRLVIDDLRTHTQGGTHARTSKQGLDLIDVGHWRELWLDHDLGEDDDIMAVVDYLCERAHDGRPVPVETVYVHSQNPVGAANAVRSLARYGYNVKRAGVEAFTA